MNGIRRKRLKPVVVEAGRHDTKLVTRNLTSKGNMNLKEVEAAANEALLRWIRQRRSRYPSEKQLITRPSINGAAPLVDVSPPQTGTESRDMATQTSPPAV